MAKPISDEFASKKAERDKLQAAHEEAVAKLVAEHRAAVAPLEADMGTLAEAFHRVTNSYPDGYQAPSAKRAARGSGQRRPRGANQEAILKVVGDRPGVSPTEIAQSTGIGQPVVYSTLTKLVEKGQVVKETLPGGNTGYKAA
ncbi:MAG TPA: helix-turn-helix domain-containing protein [Solirubrobacter sp.]|nr:helix-turn-helix domain-containing protein [Solirubrobacter sp.]